VLLLLIVLLLLFGVPGWRYGGPGISLGAIVFILVIWWLVMGFPGYPGHYYHW
jgi:hypothetical protein